jgi:hypothetical protein
MPDEIAELQEALTKIEAIAHTGKLARQEESLVGALNDIGDIVEEFLEEEEDEEPGDGAQGEEEV